MRLQAHADLDLIRALEGTTSIMVETRCDLAGTGLDFGDDALDLARCMLGKRNAGMRLASQNAIGYPQYHP